MIPSLRPGTSPTSSAPSSAAAPTATPASAPVETFDPARPETWSPLQRHAQFFDGNLDGRITLGETHQGLRALGISRLRSAAFAVVINLGLGLATGASWFRPLEIQVAKIHVGKHDSDTGVYDAEGHLDRERFETIFSEHDADADGCLTRDEVAAMVSANRETSRGSFASKAEFSLLMTIAGQGRVRDGREEQVLTRERMEQLYDGTLFYRLANVPCPFDPGA